MAAAAVVNSKTELTQFLQRFLSKTLTKADVTYSAVEQAGQYQATVRLVCHQNQEFAGELCATEKEAQQAAAAQALLAFAAERASLPAKAPKVKAPKAAGAPVQQLPQQKKAPAVVPAVTKMAVAAAGVPPKLAALGLTADFKTDLTHQVQVLLKRTLTKTDIVYEVVKVDEKQFQATVTLNGAGGQQFTGEVSSGVKLAEHAAAQQALAHPQMWGASGLAVKKSAVVVPAAGQKRKAAAPVDTSANPKSELATFLQRLLKRTLEKSDISYEVAQVATGFQATVTTNCFEARQFAGEVCAAQKAAEAAAALQAKIALTAELGEQEAQPKKPRTSKADA
mmetsp:Transcript_24243/g.75438  ORF Transcript_24243/g.75438 Transcript_24243/m.75438 type:complete len:338 (+) Transcript_24243:65-1078(+)|eukprot:CAMPEP_0204597186 /NCGR_PEP_ID=MMETSP0661-20131031/53665_1 /ASSEMBLY_ACC=CAM_ASM_000606 /TAXON_ID=109239 /ORGANISM="Alexandrium margalefi, Strain AMGDE01CS-322" /LENGTH=337 /DNA_ID=CAMNT_0051607865 /DNA_START=48 /DNA_END=1061 /DNA_ORIENTATION=-